MSFSNRVPLPSQSDSVSSQSAIEADDHSRSAGSPRRQRRRSPPLRSSQPPPQSSAALIAAAGGGGGGGDNDPPDPPPAAQVAPPRRPPRHVELVVPAAPPVRDRSFYTLTECCWDLLDWPYNNDRRDDEEGDGGGGAAAAGDRRREHNYITKTDEDITIKIASKHLIPPDPHHRDNDDDDDEDINYKYRLPCNCVHTALKRSGGPIVYQVAQIEPYLGRDSSDKLFYLTSRCVQPLLTGQTNHYTLYTEIIPSGGGAANHNDVPTQFSIDNLWVLPPHVRRALHCIDESPIIRHKLGYSGGLAELAEVLPETKYDLLMNATRYYSQVCAAEGIADITQRTRYNIEDIQSHQHQADSYLHVLPSRRGARGGGRGGGNYRQRSFPIQSVHHVYNVSRHGPHEFTAPPFHTRLDAMSAVHPKSLYNAASFAQ